MLYKIIVPSSFHPRQFSPSWLTSTHHLVISRLTVKPSREVSCCSSRVWEIHSTHHSWVVIFQAACDKAKRNNERNRHAWFWMCIYIIYIIYIMEYKSTTVYITASKVLRCHANANMDEFKTFSIFPIPAVLSAGNARRWSNHLNSLHRHRCRSGAIWCLGSLRVASGQWRGWPNKLWLRCLTLRLGLANTTGNIGDLKTCRCSVKFCPSNPMLVKQ